jgi:hypothetical protein
MVAVIPTLNVKLNDFCIPYRIPKIREIQLLLISLMTIIGIIIMEHLMLYQMGKHYNKLPTQTKKNLKLLPIG